MKLRCEMCKRNLKILVLITPKVRTFGIIDGKPFDIEDTAFLVVLHLLKGLYLKSV